MTANASPDWVLYGAYGYTGRLIVAEALRLGMRPLLAGRNAAALQALAAETGLPYQVARLDRPEELDALLQGKRLVLHVAGPFEHTGPPMWEACLRQGVHYLDITGEIPVFEALARMDDRARQAGVALLPGVGFDVVPSDGLAAHLKARLPTATHLELVICTRRARTSRGTLRTMLWNLHRPSAIRREGRIVDIEPGDRARRLRWNGWERTVYRVRWGDVSTAYHTTGIPNIQVYMCLPPALARWMPLWKRMVWLLRKDGVRRLLMALTRFLPPGPSEAERERGCAYFQGRAWDDRGREVCARLETPEGYTLTARAAVRAVARLLAEPPPPGFWTPGRLFGPDFVLGIAGVKGYLPCPEAG